MQEFSKNQNYKLQKLRDDLGLTKANQFISKCLSNLISQKYNDYRSIPEEAYDDNFEEAVDISYQEVYLGKFESRH